MPDPTETLEKPAPGVETPAPAAASDASPTPTDKAADPAQVSPEPEKTEPEALPEWMETAARGDEKRLERLKRLGDPAALLDSYLSLEAQMSKKGITLPGEKATPDELKAFAKMTGIPETPDGYKIKPNLPEGFQFSELDKGIVDNITKDLHARGGILAHPSVIQAVHELYAKSNEEAQAQLVATAAEIHNQTQAELDKEWGADKARNLTFAKSAIERYTSGEPDEVRELLQLPLMNGAKLGDFLPFTRMMAKIGREFGDDPLFAEIGANGSDGVAALEQEKAAIMKLRTDGKYAEYDAKANRLNQINDALARQSRKS